MDFPKAFIGRKAQPPQRISQPHSAIPWSMERVHPMADQQRHLHERMALGLAQVR
jgi:hypothetical protein